MKKSLAVLLFLPFFGCIKSNNSKNEKKKEKPFFAWTDSKTNQVITYDFHKDTTMLIGDNKVKFSYNKGKALVEYNPVEKGVNQRVQAVDWYFINNEVYLQDGTAIGACNAVTCLTAENKPYSVLLGTSVAKASDKFCVGEEGSDLCAVVRDSRGLGSFQNVSLKVKTGSVSDDSRKYLACWMENDPVGTVTIVTE